MAYEDVPQRILNDEAVPRSEIIGYASPMTAVQVDLILHRLVDLFIFERIIEDDRLKFKITSFGHTVRQDFVQRIEGDCPELP